MDNNWTLLWKIDFKWSWLTWSVTATATSRWGWTSRQSFATTRTTFATTAATPTDVSERCWTCRGCRSCWPAPGRGPPTSWGGTPPSVLLRLRWSSHRAWPWATARSRCSSCGIPATIRTDDSAGSIKWLLTEVCKHKVRWQHSSQLKDGALPGATKRPQVKRPNVKRPFREKSWKSNQL